MADETFNLGRASGIIADAVGQPGNRRFRILARNDYELANLWIERQQLEALAAAVQELLVKVPARPLDDPDRPPREGPTSFDLRPNIEFRVGQLGLGFEEQSGLFVIIAHDLEEEQGASPAFTCLVSREQLQAFDFAVYALVAAGRPRCPICGLPADSGQHDHAQSNGHGKGG
ncbi:MAG: DUF3090 family protein [Chloroflexi bacterium]|nr:DUF3090 family protein [Chloroflexota bacterium]